MAKIKYKAYPRHVVKQSTNQVSHVVETPIMVASVNVAKLFLRTIPWTSLELFHASVNGL